MGWLPLLGSLKLYVSFAKEPYKRDDILPKRPIILRRLLIVATPWTFSHVRSIVIWHSKFWSKLLKKRDSQKLDSQKVRSSNRKILKMWKQRGTWRASIVRTTCTRLQSLLCKRDLYFCSTTWSLLQKRPIFFWNSERLGEPVPLDAFICGYSAKSL